MRHQGYINIVDDCCLEKETVHFVKEPLSNILHLMEILVVVPVSNGFLEWMFSTMNRVHADWRNFLGEKRVENFSFIQYFIVASQKT